MKKVDAPVIKTEELEAPVAVPARQTVRVDTVALPEETDPDGETFHNDTDTPLHEADSTPNVEEISVSPMPAVSVPPPLPPEVPPPTPHLPIFHHHIHRTYMQVHSPHHLNYYIPTIGTTSANKIIRTTF